MNAPRSMLVILIVAFLALIVFALKAGGWLVRNDELRPSDLIVIMMGPVPDRALQAAELYQKGFAKHIVFTNEFQPGADQLEPLGIKLETTADVFRKALVKLGVPDSAIILLPYVSSSTQDEALWIAKFLADNPQYQSLILVTSSYHSRRAGAIFRQVLRHLPDRLQMTVSPNPYTSFRVEDWWKDRMSAKLLILEYIKWTHFQLSERWRIKKELRQRLANAS